MRKTGKIRDTRRTGKTGQIMDPTHFARAFFFFFALLLACFTQGSLVGISWIYKEGSSTSWGKEVNISNVILKILILKKN